MNQATVLRYWSLCVVYKFCPAHDIVNSELEHEDNDVKSHLIVSDGVTAIIASIIPAPSPAKCVVV